MSCFFPSEEDNEEEEDAENDDNMSLRQDMLAKCHELILRVGAEEDDWITISCLEMALLMSWQACILLFVIWPLTHPISAHIFEFSAGKIIHWSLIA